MMDRIDYKVEKERIRGQFDCLLGVWEGDPAFNIEDCMDEEVYTAFSNFGKIFTRTALLLKMRDTTKNHLKLSVLQYHCRIAENRAYQHVTVLGYMHDNITHICFGGTFFNVLEWDGRNWKFREIRFELQSDDGIGEQYLTEDGHIITSRGQGNRLLMKNWKMVNDRVGYFMEPVYDQGQHVLLGEADALWYRCKKDSDGDPGSDEAQINEVFARFCYAYDFSTLMLLKDITTDDLNVHSGKAGDMNKLQTFGYLYKLRQGLTRSFTSGKLRDLQICGDHAACVADMYAPEKFSFKWDESGEWSDGCICDSFSMKFRKEDSGWKIEEADFY